jgi:hypothetical protein
MAAVITSASILAVGDGGHPRELHALWHYAGGRAVELRASSRFSPHPRQDRVNPAALLLLRTPEGGKGARLQAASPQVESCNVYLPHPAIAPWVEGFIDECSSFPNREV